MTPADPEETRLVLTTTLTEIRDCLLIGLENTRELLAKHDADLGREHRHNRITAETMENEIGQLEAVMVKLDNILA